MSEQRQHDNLTDGLRPSANGDDATGGVERLADARAELEEVYAAADAILEGIRLGNSERFLEQIRQSGGQ